MAASITILGIDPGSRNTGFGLLKVSNNQFFYADCGVIKTPNRSHIERLETIYAQVKILVEKHRPDEVAIEKVFVQRNVDSALKLGQARASALCGVFAGKIDAGQCIDFAEYSPRDVKQAVVGYGAAKKDQVQHMIKTLLSLNEAPAEDASDALAVALCHALKRAHKKRIAIAVEACS